MSLLCAWPVLHAQETGKFDVRVLVPEDSAAAQRIVATLRAAFPSLVVLKDARPAEHPLGEGVNLLLGPAAVRLATHDDLPGISIAIFASSEAVVASGLLGRRNFTAIYSDPAPLQQLRLLRQIYGRDVRVGVLLSSVSEHLRRPLQEAAAREGVEIRIERLGPDENPIRALGRLHDITAVLAEPDSLVFNPLSLRTFIESTYRRGLPVIGYTATMVTAGTLATTYADTEDIVAQLREVVAACQGGRVPEAQFPKYWRVAVNDSVARSLNIPISDAIRALASRPR